jgi:hypothetical protein
MCFGCGCEEFPGPTPGCVVLMGVGAFDLFLYLDLYLYPNPLQMFETFRFFGTPCASG